MRKSLVWVVAGCLLLVVATRAFSQPSDDEGNRAAADPAAADPTDSGDEGSADDADQAAEQKSGWMKKVDTFFGRFLVKPLETVLFFDLWTSKFLKVPGAWQYDSEAETGDPRNKTIVKIFSEDEVTIEVTELVNGKKSELTFQADTVEQLYAQDPDAYRLYQQYATDEYRVGVSIPLVVLWLFAGAIYFTIRMGFINVRGFWHAIRLTKGDYDDPQDQGEVSHFQALASALSATVGLGNIAGVAIAIGTGGPGATFWMIVIGLLGMSTKFSECTLGQMYRKVEPDGTVSGGPMRYLRVGLAEMGWPRLGGVLATIFIVLCIGASFGGGNAFQVGQSLTAVQAEIPFLVKYPWVYGLVMSIMVGIVIVGGIRSIGAVAGRIVPFMCGAYVLAAMYILVTNIDRIGPAFGSIFSEAFAPRAVYGGILGVMVTGIRRAVFSNEAGAGSAAIAHSAAKTDEPVSEGIVALLEPFIDTVVVCTMTALVIIVTGVYDNPSFEPLVAGNNGAALTAEAFKSGGHEWFRWILYAAVVLFAYSTLISWSYYGERCSVTLLGPRASLPYKAVFLVFAFLGSVVTRGKILEFSDLLILGMAFPNVLGVVILSGKVRKALDNYWQRYRNGELDRSA